LLTATKESALLTAAEESALLTTAEEPALLTTAEEPALLTTACAWLRATWLSGAGLATLLVPAVRLVHVARLRGVPGRDVQATAVRFFCGCYVCEITLPAASGNEEDEGSESNA
jgi:hypothetical protein